MAQQLNPLSALLASHIGAPVQVAAAPLLSQLLANAPKEVLEDGPKACAPCHLNRRASYSSWLLTPISPQSYGQPGREPVNGRLFSLYFALSLCHSDFQINKVNLCLKMSKREPHLPPVHTEHPWLARPSTATRSEVWEGTELGKLLRLFSDLISGHSFPLQKFMYSLYVALKFILFVYTFL